MAVRYPQLLQIASTTKVSPCISLRNAVLLALGRFFYSEINCTSRTESRGPKVARSYRQPRCSTSIAFSVSTSGPIPIFPRWVVKLLWPSVVYIHVESRKRLCHSSQSSTSTSHALMFVVFGSLQAPVPSFRTLMLRLQTSILRPSTPAMCL